MTSRWLQDGPRVRGAVLLLLCALVVAVYGQTGTFPFVKFDDDAFISGNPAVQGGLTLEGVRWAISTDMDAGWIPLTWLSRLVDVSLFGMDAGGHHLVNVLFHLLNVLLLFHVLRRMTGRLPESGLVAALFAVHPLHVESVAWVTERKDVLAGFFWMLSLGAYARYAERPGALRYLAVVLCFALGLMSKPIVVTLPFVLLLLDCWPLRRFRMAGESFPPGETRFVPAPASRLLLEKAPLLAMSAAASAVTILFQKQIGAVTSFEAIPPWARAGNALLSWFLYLRKTAWPFGLAPFYPHPGTGISPWAVAGSALFLAAVTALALRSVRSRRWFAVGWFWYVGTLVPVIGLLNVGGKAMADRCTYIPLIGVYLVFAWGASGLVSRWRTPPAAAAAAAALLVLLLGLRAFDQAGKWRSTEALFAHTVETTGENWLAQNMLGLAAYEGGRDLEALRHFREALRIWPDLPEVNNSIGMTLLRMGDPEGALAHFRRELRVQPRFAEAWFNAGVALDALGRPEEAFAAYSEALRVDPGHPEANNNLGVHLAALGMHPEAIARFREALRRRPDYAEGHHGLAMSLAAVGDVEDAIRHLRTAIRLRPSGYPEAHNNLGTLLARQGAFGEAATHFREALRLKPDYEKARRNLERVTRDAARST
jgi:tetratricopeptide (TPR) repeat protein